MISDVLVLSGPMGRAVRITGRVSQSTPWLQVFQAAAAIATTVGVLIAL